ncbi:hypothetical protein J4Z35_00525 [Dermacoccus sp. NHGro5]|nr:hypothetical protein [Dermacoccus sp. NHGro5]
MLGDSPADTPRHYGAPTPAPALDQQAPPRAPPRRRRRRRTPCPRCRSRVSACRSARSRARRTPTGAPPRRARCTSSCRWGTTNTPRRVTPSSSRCTDCRAAQRRTASSTTSTRVDRAVSDRRIAAPIVVVPQLNRTLDDDTECSDDPHGLQTETWLASTLPTWVKHTFAVAPGRGSWATWGYSLGGWCASMLTMKHPATFGAAVAYQGYFRPQFDGHPPFPPTRRRRAATTSSPWRKPTRCPCRCGCSPPTPTR